MNCRSDVLIHIHKFTQTRSVETYIDGVSQLHYTRSEIHKQSSANRLIIIKSYNGQTESVRVRRVVRTAVKISMVVIWVTKPREL